MTYIPPVKNIEPSITKILELINPANYKVKLSGHHLNDRVFEVEKVKRQFNFNSTAKILKGLQTHKELNFESQDIVELAKDDFSIYILGKYILLNKISYDDEHLEKVFGGNISSFSTCKNLADFENTYMRCIIPVGNKEGFHSRDFEGSYFITPSKRHIEYTSITISDEIFHFFNFKLGSEYYIVLDCISLTTLIKFQKKCFNLLLTLGFIKGDLIHDEAYFFSYPDENMDKIDNLLYHSMRSTVRTNQPTFTTNPYSVHSDIDFERDETGFMKSPLIDMLNKEMTYFPSQVFSTLSTLLNEHEKLQRAVLIYIQSNIASLEIRIPNYYVAIEAITGYISSELASGKKSLSPIKDSKIAAELIKEIVDISQKAKDKQKLDDVQFDMEIFLKNIQKLNAPPNADKLTESFTHIGYVLTKEQKGLLKERNRFLHGSFLKTIGDDEEFKAALHVSLRLHFMIAVLIYKLSGYSGRIINYSELWSHMTEKKLGEERLVKI
ncbi:hypothetical protein BC749_108272 [Flavobacterium araucananum]|uniref:hypothetical protein n=1 Tax=Flavobacterium araucananum TaxID=946678 RepID=UPI000D6BD60F|nr:hypothetical protein [Flavobacterium araucananum]PWJ97121.1 hypothetical protein BC749_108272 [Flavobacterium araucananum]